MATRRVKVLKFGGTSMASPESIRQVISILKKPERGVKTAAVVVSAMSSVTDQLIKIAKLAAAKDESYIALLDELKQRHLDTVRGLVRRKNRKQAVASVRTLFGYLEGVIKGIRLVRELSPGALDYIMSYGERLSAHILTEALLDRSIRCEYLNARTLIMTDDNFGSAAVDFEVTNRNIRKHFKTHKSLQVVTGFIASTKDKKTTTLGRGGSDYTASILGAALGAKVIEIWTDVSGVMTADPRKVKNALPIASMTYNEAVEMSYFGAKVIHPPTIRPAEEKNIPLLIKNTFEPSAPGTIVRRGHSTRKNGALAKGISSINDIAMLQVEGNALPRLRGAAGRIFAALAESRINVILITQASSQHSVSFAVAPQDAEHARKSIETEFRFERESGFIDDISIRRDLSIIAIVGEGMRENTGTAGRLFDTLGKNGINVVAIAQGSSELNISVVVEKSDETKALNAIHTGFFFPEIKPLNVFLVGTGLIGSTLLAQIARQRDHLRREYGYAIRICGIANAKKMLFDENGIDPANWEEALTTSRRRMNVEKFIEAVQGVELPGRVFVDCTASEDIADQYGNLLASRVSVVTPNKRANSGKFSYYKRLKELAKKPGISFFFETNAGAALPVISILRDLQLSGDKITKIEAILSGTLSHIFNNFTGKKLFSNAVARAKKLGFTEPDPREDLRGTDVARKVLILARECGFPLELSNVKVESLLSRHAASASSIGDFFEELKKDDRKFEKKKREAEEKGRHLRYIATLKNGRAAIALKAVSPSHPFYNMSGSDNIIAFTTRRYNKTPLVVKGPGAGAEVTAAGVFADILRTARDSS